MQQGAVFAGRYTIVRKLGHGLSGEVYLATDSLLKGSHVALKILSVKHEGKPGFVERFMREIELTRRVSSDYVVRTYDIGRDADHLYFTMEYLDGGSLQNVIGSGTITLAEAIRYLVQVLQGLQEIHRCGIVHRDLKPQNVLRSTNGSLKLVDFGLARSGDSTLTSDHFGLGTAAYMAPEIWRGEPATVASDLYAFGVIAYELISGTLPFDSPVSATLMYMHLEEQVPEHRSLIESGLWPLVHGLLAKNPKKRPQSCEEVLIELRRVAAERLPPQLFTQLFSTVESEAYLTMSTKMRQRRSNRLRIGAVAAGAATMIAALYLVISSMNDSQGAAAPPIHLLQESALWLSADSLAGADDLATPIETWESLHPESRLQAVQPVEQSRPQLLTDTSGVRALSFDGIDDFFEVGTLAPAIRDTEHLAVFFTAKLKTRSDSQQFVWSLPLTDNNENNGARVGAYQSRLRINLSSFWQDNGSPDIDTRKDLVLDKWFVCGLICDRTLCTLRYNKETVAEVSLPRPLTLGHVQSFLIGQELDRPHTRGFSGDEAINSDFMAGQLREIAVFTKPLTIWTARAVEDALIKRSPIEVSQPGQR